MGKKGGSSWLTAVKRAFRSPTKETDKKSGRRREDHDQEEDEEKKREKRRWIFRKPTTQETASPQTQSKVPASAGTAGGGVAPVNDDVSAAAAAEQRHAIAVAAAEAAVATAQAAVDVARLARPSSNHYARENYAAIVIQTAFRGYLSREGSSIADDWDERPHTIEEVKAMLQNRKEAALKREKNLSQAFSQQIWRGRSPSMGNEDELEEKPKWLDRWMATKPWDNRGRASTDQRDPIKTVEIDTSQLYSYLAPNFRRSNQNQYQPNQFQRLNSHTVASPLHRAHQNVPHHQPPITPSPSKTRPLQVRSASPRCGREDRSFHTSQTPSLRSNYYYNGRGATTSSGSGGPALPNYMAATESAKARVRSQSAPRQRPSTPERERGGAVASVSGSARKRLSFPVPDPYSSGIGYGGYGHNLRSPSFKSVSGGYLGLEQQSNYSSCCTESFGGEISPSSTSGLRRWMR